MTKRFCSRSMKKYLRREKARIRKASANDERAEELIRELYARCNLKPKTE